MNGDLTPLVQSFWGRNVITGSSCLLALDAPLTSHTETIPLVLPLTRNCPLLGRKRGSWQTGVTLRVEPCSRPLTSLLEPGMDHSHLRVQIKVDALIGAHFPTQRPQKVARLPEIPAQKFSILEVRTGVWSQPLSPLTLPQPPSPSNFNTLQKTSPLLTTHKYLSSS